MYKRILAGVFAVLMAVSVFAGCNNKESEAPEIKLNVETPVKNKEVWHTTEEEGMSTYGYCVVDLDQDGNIEIMSAVNGGKFGDLTRTRYYTVDENTKVISEIKHSAGESEADVTYGVKTCYKNTETGQYFYIFYDRIQPSVAEKYERKVAVSYFDGEITETILAEKSEITDISTEETTITYKDAKGNELTEQEYRSIASKVYAGYEVYNVDFAGFKGYDQAKNEQLKSMSDDELSQMLRDSFAKFRVYK